MGTTKVKVIDLSSDEPDVKASRKAASKMRPSINTEEKPQEKTARKRPSIATEEESPLPKTGAKQKAKEAEATTTKPTAKVHPRGAKYKKAASAVEKGKAYPAREAFELLGKTSYTKFDPTVEVHLNVTAKNVKGSVNFPHAIGPKKEKKYLVFSDRLKSTDLKNVVVAGDSTIDDIASGKLKPGRDFNAVIAAAKFMPQMAKIAKVLGPAGMMPNPKNGTITDSPEKTIGEGATDAYEFRSDPTAPIVHTKLGKLSSKPEELQENLKALVTAIGSTKIKKAVLTSTMSPGIRIDVSSL